MRNKPVVACSHYLLNPTLLVWMLHCTLSGHRQHMCWAGSGMTPCCVPCPDIAKVMCRTSAGFAKVIKDAAQKAKAEAKAASTPATAGQAATAASAKSKAAKRVPKAVQLPPVTPSQGATADPAVDLGRALAQAASSAAANAEAAAEAAQQQSAAQAQSREQRLRARQGLNPGPTEPEQEERPHEQEQEQEEQMPEVQLPNAKDKARGARESTPAVQNGGKRRKLAPGLMESLANGGDSTSADAQVSLAACVVAAGSLVQCRWCVGCNVHRLASHVQTCNFERSSKH